jgi:uncharacterized protein YdeI (YjbR/CyaY-like superfamily)
MVYNEFIRRAVGKEMGDSLHVTLEKDDQPRVFTVPAELETILREAGVLEAFSKQPDYAKREQVNKILLAKKEETKTSRIQKLIEELSGK